MDKNKIQSLPDKSGVYIYKNSSGTVIYIGKAKSLKHRVSSYFTGLKKDVKTQILSSQVSDMDFIVTKNELEAFLLENSLIKEHNPRYNILLKDDKSYPYIQITEGEKYPGVYITRTLKTSARKDTSAFEEKTKNRKRQIPPTPNASRENRAIEQSRIDSTKTMPYPGAKGVEKYYGPYYALEAKRVVQAIYSIFKIRQCTYEFEKKPLKRPCIYYDTGVCSAPCVRFISEEEYNASVKDVQKFLRGAYKATVSLLESRMNEYSKKHQYEKAAAERDAIAAVKGIMAEQKVVDADERDIDVLDFVSEGGYFYVCVLNVRGGRLINKRMDKSEAAGDAEEQFENYFFQYYSREVYEPDEIIVPEQSVSDEVAGHVLSGKKSALKFSKAGRLLLMARENINEKIKQEQKQREAEAKREKEYEAAAKQLKEALGLPEKPEYIDCLDISHLHGENTVASAVVFRNGSPDKNLYRRYRIRTVKFIDDFESMREAVKRRYSRMMKEDLPMPGLVLIDGGIGQVNAAKEALDLVGIEVPVAGLAKREELVFLPGKNEGLVLPKEARFALMRARDEAHRFAVSYQFLLANKKMKETVFENIPGIGEKTMREIYRTFKDTQDLVDSVEANDERAGFLNKKQKEQILKKLINDKG